MAARLLFISLLLSLLPDLSRPSTLDPRQLTALQSIGLTTAKDPCENNRTTTCDNAQPFRHIISLTLEKCPTDMEISTTALRALSTLTSISFEQCPVAAPHKLPPTLTATLRAFSAVSSLRRLSALWLSRLQNLTEINIVDVPVDAGAGPAVIFSQMRHLIYATVASANLTGGVPHHWHCQQLRHLDLSDNRLKGAVPSSIAMLASLQTLNLSFNSLAGTLPESIGNLVDLKNVSLSHNSISGPVPDSMSQLQGLVHLDFSSNQFNGSIPKFIAEMRMLKFLNLENNFFRGVIPFNTSFIKSLEVFKIGGNGELCYNHTLLSSKLQLGIALCDKHGQPLSPPPRSDTNSDYSDDGVDNVGKGGGGGHHGPSKMILGVAIGLSLFVFLLIFLVCISKMCG